MPDCPDGTVVTLGASNATSRGARRVLPLPAPLSIGDNDLVREDRSPAGGRDEDVKVQVPVAYRVRADLTTLSARPPAITVRIEATAGNDVRVDDKPITLDENGRGAYAIDVERRPRGRATPRRSSERSRSRSRRRAAKPESGQLTARTRHRRRSRSMPRAASSSPTRGAPRSRDRRAPARRHHRRPERRRGCAGTLRRARRAPAVGREDRRDRRNGAAARAAHRASAKVVRVASLDDAAKESRTRQNPSPSTPSAPTPARRPARRRSSRARWSRCARAAGHTVLLVEEKKSVRRRARRASCASFTATRTRSRAVTASRVRTLVGAVTASGKTVPEVEAMLVIALKARGRSEARTMRTGASVAHVGSVAVPPPARAALRRRPRRRRAAPRSAATRASSSSAHPAARRRRTAAMRGGAARRRTSAPGGLRIAWRKTIGLSIEQPALAGPDGTLAVVTARGDVIFLDSDGEEKARATAGSAAVGPATTTSDGTVVFTTSAGDAVGIRPSSSRLASSRASAASATCAPRRSSLDDGGVVVATLTDLVVLDAEGNVRSRVALPEAPAAPLLASGDKVVAVTATGAVYGWTPGRELVRLGSFGAPIDGGAALADANT